MRHTKTLGTLLSLQQVKPKLPLWYHWRLLLLGLNFASPLPLKYPIEEAKKIKSILQLNFIFSALVPSSVISLAATTQPLHSPYGDHPLGKENKGGLFIGV